jgi:hypothetical protein
LRRVLPNEKLDFLILIRRVKVILHRGVLEEFIKDANVCKLELIFANIINMTLLLNYKRLLDQKCILVKK